MNSRSEMSPPNGGGLGKRVAPIAAALFVVGCASDESVRMSRRVYNETSAQVPVAGAMPSPQSRIMASPQGATVQQAKSASPQLDSLGVAAPPSLASIEPLGSKACAQGQSIEPGDQPPTAIKLSLDPKAGPKIVDNRLPTTQAPALTLSPRNVFAFQPLKLDPDLKPAGLDPNIVVPAPSVIPASNREYPIDLATALRLADVANPTIAAARTQILEALAQQLAARTLLVPSLNGGATYHDHNGLTQRSNGKMINLTQQSFYFGAGARGVTAETIGIPGVNIFAQLTDAWFEPLAARQRVIAREFNASATANEILLDVAQLHLELLGAQAVLEAQRLSEREAYEIVRVTDEYATTGEGRKADAERAKVEWSLRRGDVQKAEETVGVAAARLAMRLNLDPSVTLVPVGGPLVPIFLIDLNTTQQDLIRVALDNRPDLAKRSAQIAEAEVRKSQEIGRPLLPTLWLGFSAGAFGGGSNLTPPLMGRFAGRNDFDVRLYWNFLNMGVGNLALIRQRDAELGAAVAERQRTINLARKEVSQALADTRAAFHQIDIARGELVSSRQGFQEDLARTRANLGKPIEVVNSLHLLADARVRLVQALLEFDQSQFRLWVALGTPPPLVDMQSNNAEHSGVGG